MSTLTPGAAASALIPVPFRDATLTLIDHAGEPYVAMRPLVEAMGMNWKGQFDKLTHTTGRFISTVVEIHTVAQDGKQRKMLCLPLRKLAGWMMTIHPGNVRPELRERIRAYQAECDDALWAYWTQGHATRPAAAALPPPDKVSRALRQAINRKAHEIAVKQFDAIHALISDAVEDNLACGASEADALGYVETYGNMADGTTVINQRDLFDIVWAGQLVINTAAQAVAAIRRIEQRSGLNLGLRLPRSKHVDPDFHKHDSLVDELLARMAGLKGDTGPFPPTPGEKS